MKLAPVPTEVNQYRTAPEHFLSVPSHVATHPALKRHNAAKLVYGSIHTRSAHGGRCRARAATLADDVGVSRRTVFRAVNLLESLGFLQILKIRKSRNGHVQREASWYIPLAQSDLQESGESGAHLTPYDTVTTVVVPQQPEPAATATATSTTTAGISETLSRTNPQGLSCGAARQKPSDSAAGAYADASRYPQTTETPPATASLSRAADTIRHTLPTAVLKGNAMPEQILQHRRTPPLSAAERLRFVRTPAEQRRDYDRRIQAPTEPLPF